MREEAARALSRGVHLAQIGRHEEAEKFLSEALVHEPESAEICLQLALCLDEIDGQRKRALATIDRAITHEPEEAIHHIVRAQILSGLNKGNDALEAAQAAVTLEPEWPPSHCAVARAQLSREHWADAEAAARKALAIDGDDDSAQGILAVALRMQGKRAEDEVAVERLLSENPEDKFSHLNAGFSALRRFDHAKAEEHFRESLRLDADFEPAREGLVESYRARSAFYRGYQRYCFWMQRFTSGNRFILIIGIYLAFRFGRAVFAAIHPALAVLFVIVYLAFVFWVWLARGIGNFLIYMDRSARQALRTSERLEALFVGAAFIGGLLLVIVGLVLDVVPLAFAGGALALGALPASLTFTNESSKGRLVFGGVLGLVYLAGFGAALTIAIGSSYTEFFMRLCGIAALAVMLCTWIANIPSLRR